MYSLLFRTLLRRLDPEQAHHLSFPVIRALGAVAPALRRLTVPRGTPSVEALGLRFETPFGVAAGFDKDATAVLGFGALGFGHVEVGTLTARAQPGNDRPRLFRVIADRAVINRMGFNNHGAQAAAKRLVRLRSVRHRPVIGVNIGKSRVVEVDDAIEDYLISTRLLAPLADYLVVNVSSPNTPGLRGLQEIDRLEPLLAAVKDAADATPLLVKIAPDLSDDEVGRVAELAVRLGLDGIIATNTTLSREGLATDRSAIEAAGAGGLSGAPLATRSLEVLRVIRATVPAAFCVISVGGVETAADVQQRLDAGATLVQGYTAFIYRGPLWARTINRGLARAS
ncbi:quinone-dependent dihydroorotate dehydrogenase [Rathayibacter rathayi]|uniref:Dihydroorotate dehydrogenase (quinone) n=1 Tax=Rathayibacter rathayi TaxID=33887 RepID=A0ABD6W9C8_RATRA|nr:quinone-dependent dihydroorotate dehydrogenase [Rathayibacter rathayi]AZZ48619.1 quinone-dependent dihydroorotate dehydrogenase [Rathayibacter rathayi]MWV74941.1 quinone-dependent dihydroorotate dehydrogenase [Rathayibacter rathayi NCPPB 2980 = VKM Ac-1601]PPF14439.1 quinone-dependent dihydroorotate dehydrogenase [Rathayibacter rathayi]PPF23174.1 quinone-dependent dihydroorotate dehydrogenase [Rathayibacter rathayi]PPF51530.1 quinone-dependent dihydroorotate dehydrogenase [Rathayibacter rat